MHSVMIMQTQMMYLLISEHANKQEFQHGRGVVYGLETSSAVSWGLLKKRN